MSRMHISPRNIIIIIISFVFLAVVVGYMARGWVRTTVAPTYASLTQGQGMESSVEDEMKNLGQPFDLLGFQDVKKEKKCTLDYARLLTTRVNCTYRIDSSQVIARSWLSPTELRINGTSLQDVLQKNGWQGVFDDDNPATSMREFVTAMEKNNDAIPDATYTKSLGDINCTFTTVVASSGPIPLAMASHLICGRTSQIF